MINHLVTHIRYIAIIAVFSAILPIHSNAYADWCSGNSWVFFKMPIAKRVTKAKTAITQELKLVTTNIQAITKDTNQQHSQLVQALNQEQQVLITKAQNQCQAMNQNPAQQLARRNQLRLDLATLNAMREVRQRLAKHVQDQAALVKQLKAQRYELQNLQQRLANLISANYPLLESDLTLRSACSAITASKTLRANYRPLSREFIDHQVLQLTNLFSKTPDATITKVMQTCNIAQAMPVDELRTVAHPIAAK